MPTVDILAIAAHRDDVELSCGGTLLVAGACACWALDNNIAARLALKDPVQVLRVKALCAGKYAKVCKAHKIG